MGIESSSFRSTDGVLSHERNRIEHPTLVKMHEKARNVLQEGAIDPNRFVDLYGQENVTKDLKKVESLKAKFESSESKSAADIFEALVYTHTELSDWLGPNAETVRTSEYDDYINHVDLVVEFSENNTTNHLALGVDVTFGSSSMQKKFELIKNEIDNDQLAVVKYFEAHGYKGSLRQLPRVVIGVELNKVIQLAGLWERGDNKILGDHITKDIIAKEIQRQLNTFLIYAKSKGKDNAVKSYLKALATLRNVFTLRNGFSDDLQRRRIIDDDRVYRNILEHLELFQRSSRG